MNFRNCTICDKPNEQGNRFCIHCGAELSKLGSTSTPKDAEPVEENNESSDKYSINAIATEVSKLRKEVDELRKKLHMVTSGNSGLVKSKSAETPTNSERLSTPQVGKTQLQTRKLFDWEQIPGNWFARIGGLAILIGIAFFLALAFDNHWIEATGQVAIGISTGIFLLLIGEYWQRKYRIWSQSVSGTAIAILYASIFAAFGIHELIHAYVAFCLLIIVTVTTAALSIRYDALPLAVLAVLGGLATPLLLNSDLPEPRLMLPYILILDLGVLVLASLKNWRWITLIAAVGSYGLVGTYIDQREELSLTILQTGLTLIFLIFVGATTVFHLIWR